MENIQGELDIWTFHLYGTLIAGVVVTLFHLIVLEFTNLFLWSTPRSTILRNYAFIIFALSIGYLGAGLFLGVQVHFFIEPADRIMTYLLYGDGYSVFFTTSALFGMYNILKGFRRETSPTTNPYERTYIDEEEEEEPQDELEILKQELQKEKEKAEGQPDEQQEMFDKPLFTEEQFDLSGNTEADV